ncbi:RICIN domain-containing protein [Streptomyces fumanus]|uniref:RICIN domain-containing protein n=1 Tax=Streptomyces fumanus TaxID=67302 RepID=UPI0033D2E314
MNITSDFAGRSHTNQCLDVDVTGNGANGSKIQVWECNGSSQQLWYWWDDYFLESARYPGKCIDADLNGGGANGTRLQLWDCNGSTQQQFFRYSNDLAIYNARFYNNGNTVVDRNATVPGNGAGVQLWQKNYQSQQWWSVR